MATRLEDADLTEGQRLLLRALAGSPLRDAFYLTGGSNLAGFRFRHRRSDDKVLALIERREGKDLVDLWKLTAERGGTALRNAIADAERKFGTRGLRYGLQGALVAAASAAAPRLHEPHDFDAARTWARDAAQRLARESLDEDQGKD